VVDQDGDGKLTKKDLHVAWLKLKSFLTNKMPSSGEPHRCVPLSGYLRRMRGQEGGNKGGFHLSISVGDAVSFSLE
jgi:hypothetical protein